MTIKRIMALTVFVMVTSNSFAQGGADNVSSGCATLEFMAKMVTLNRLLPANDDHVAEFVEIESQLKQMNRLVCQPVILTGFTRGNSHYDNGALASTDLYYDAWRFPNGQKLFSGPGLDTPIFYPTGCMVIRRCIGRMAIWRHFTFVPLM